MKKLLLLVSFCLFFVSGLFAQQKLDVIYEDDATLFCRSEYMETYLIAAALRHDFKYVNLNSEVWYDAKEYFSPYKDHSFIKNLDKLTGYSDNTFHNYAVLNPFYNYTFNEDFDNLSKDKIVKSYTFYSAFSAKKSFGEFITELEKFYADANVSEFFDAHSEYTDKLNKDVLAFCESGKFAKYMKCMENYIGKENLPYNPTNFKYTILISFFREDTGGASFGIYNNGKYDLLMCDTSPLSWYTDDVDVEMIIVNSIHEYLHNYINRYVQARSSMIERLAKKKDMKDYGGYGVYAKNPWYRMVDENFVRVIEARIYADILGEDNLAYELILKSDVERGGFISALRPYNALVDYEQNRDKYPSIDLYMDTLIEALFTEEE